VPALQVHPRTRFFNTVEKALLSKNRLFLGYSRFGIKDIAFDRALVKLFLRQLMQRIASCDFVIRFSWRPRMQTLEFGQRHFALAIDMHMLLSLSREWTRLLVP
jgi:hypothetical protein